MPADLNFDGLLVHIHSFENEAYDIIGMGEDCGDVVMDAVYHRTLNVSDRLNVKIEWADSATTKWQDFSAELNSTIMAGDDAWQLVYAMGNSAIQSNRGNLFMDLSNAKYLDYSKPWWWSEAMEEVSFDGKERKYLVGDIYGLIFANHESFKHSEHALGIQHYYRDENGYPVIEYDLDRATLAVEKLYNLAFETKGVMFQTEYLDAPVFTEGSLFFYPNQILKAFLGEFREMEDDYGIIPYPKLDESQENYHNLLHNSSNYVTIPITCQNPDEVGAVIEAMCAESYRSVVEVFYEIALKTKYSRDSYSGQCIDLIRDITKKNFAYEYDGQYKCGVLISDCVRNGGGNFSSSYASSISMANKILEKTLKQLAKEKAAG